MNLLQDILTYIRRIIKSPSNSEITDSLLIDYVNRFWLMDVDARLQLFDLKTTYRFQTVPGVDRYNMPLYDVQLEPGGQSIASYPVYQQLFEPAYINGIEMPFYTQRSQFYSLWPDYNQVLTQAGTGNGTNGPYTLSLPILPNAPNALNFPVSAAIIRGHVDITGVITSNQYTGTNQDPPLDSTGDGVLITQIPSTSIDSQVFFLANNTDGSNIVVQDTGIFINGQQNLGLLMAPGTAPYGNSSLQGGYNSSFVITGATNANPCVLTATTTYAIGQSVTIENVLGMTQLNGNTYTVTANGGTTLSINVNSTGFGTYVSGGTVSSFSNVINYLTGIATNVFFPKPIPNGMPIQAQCVYYQMGIPRAVLFYDNCISLRAPPNTQYLVELNAYLSPAAFFSSSQAIPFAYMAEYIARGAARKILSDTGDMDQFNFYEQFFIEQELLVWKRSQRQWTSTRTPSFYINQGFQGNYNQSSMGV